MTRRKSPVGRPSQRESLLDAAQSVVLEQGALQLTLDAVAARAGISKSGLRYHFVSKDDLLRAMVDRLIQHNTAALADAMAKTPLGPTQALQAYVSNSVRDPKGDGQLSGALLAAVANDPRLLAPVRDYFKERFKKLHSGIELEHAALVHLATEGLWLMELMHISPFEGRSRNRIVKALTQLAAANE